MLDGADAVMLSGETSVGEYPILTVQTMARIIEATEADPVRSCRRCTHDPRTQARRASPRRRRDIADGLDAKALVAFTQSGDTVRRLARLHCRCRCSRSPRMPDVRSQLALSWGVGDVPRPASSPPTQSMRQVDQALLRWAGRSDGDIVVIVAGSPPGTVGSTNLLRVHRLATDDTV